MDNRNRSASNSRAPSTPKVFASQNHLPIQVKLHNMRLMQFPQALETVLQTLERIREQGARRPCASRSALKTLDRAAPIRASEPVPESKIHPPSVRTRLPLGLQRAHT